MAFTLVFNGDISQAPNPLRAETPFGTARAACAGDALDKKDKLEDALLAMCREVDIYDLECADQVQAALGKT